LDDFDDPGLPPIRSGFINGHANQVSKLIDWLVFNAHFSSISAISWHG
jgi:hypothetical protein